MLSESPARPAAGVANYQIHMHAGLRGPVEGRHDFAVFQGVGLELDQAGVVLTVAANLALDLAQQGASSRGEGSSLR